MLFDSAYFAEFAAGMLEGRLNSYLYKSKQIADKLGKCLDIFYEIMYKIINERRLSYESICLSKNRVVSTVSGSGKSSGPYCEWEL